MPFLVVLFVQSYVCGAELKAGAKPTLFPYQDYLVVIVHGINDSHLTPIGENPEQKDNPEMQKRWAIRNKLRDLLAIPDGYIQAYSYSQTRGSNLQNAMELGLSGYTPPHQGNKTPNLGVLKAPAPVNTKWLFPKEWITLGTVVAPVLYAIDKKIKAGPTGNAEITEAELGTYMALVLILNSQLGVLDQNTITGAGLDAEINGNPLPTIGFEPKRKRNEYFPYYPATNAYYAGGIQPGNSFLEQAVVDFKEWFVNGPEGEKNFISDVKDPAIEAFVPKKFILITHSGLFRNEKMSIRDC